MVRIEIKKTVKGQMMLAVEAEHESLDEVLTCAARCFVGVARKLLGPISTDPLFADEAAKLIKDLLTDTEGFKVTEGYEGKEAKFIAALNGMNAGEQTDEEFHELTAMIKGVVRPGRRKMTPDEAKLWAEVSRINTRLKDEMVNAGFAVRALPGDLQEDAINVLSRTVSGMLGDLTAMMAETGEP